MASVNLGHARVDEILVLLLLVAQVLCQSLMRCCSEKRIEVTNADSADVDWKALLGVLVHPVRQRFLDRWQLRKRPIFIQGVHILGLAPLRKLSEHELDFCLVKFSSAAEAQDVRLIKYERLHVEDLLAAHPILNQVHHVFLLWR